MDMEIDFDEWAKLAQDPQEFERKRHQIIDNFIVSAPPDQQKSLRELQAIIDAERQMSATPQEACERIIDMAMNLVGKEGGLLDFQNRASFLIEDLKILKNKSSKMRLAAEEFRKVAGEISEFIRKKGGVG